MKRTMDTIGLPDERNFITRPDESRALLTDALKRGYAFRDHDGVRSYYRVERLAAIAKAASDNTIGSSLHGLGMFQVEMLRSQATLLLQLLDELPAMLPYTPVRTSYDAEQLRDRVRVGLDDIVAIASAPLGPTLGQSEGRFRRLVLAVADWLERGGIATCKELRHAASQRDIKTLLAALGRAEHCMVPGAVVPTREINLRIRALQDALKSIGSIVTAPRTADVGRAGSELEQTMTLLATAADGLQQELERLGTSADEQQVVYFGGHAHPDISISQFAEWIDDVSAPFATGDDESISLRPDDLRVLAIDLDELSRLAEKLEQHAATYTAELRLIGARRQMKEVGYLLRRANDAAATMVADRSAA